MACTGYCPWCQAESSQRFEDWIRLHLQVELGEGKSAMVVSLEHRFQTVAADGLVAVCDDIELLFILIIQI